MKNLKKIAEKIHLSRLTAMFFGGLITLFIFLPFAFTHEDRQYPFGYGSGYDPSTLAGYEAFSPRLRNQEKFVIIGGCYVSLPIIANDLNSAGFRPRTGGLAWFGNVLNFVLRNEYDAETKTGFYDMSAPNTGMATHIRFIHQALKVPNIKSLIYLNGISTSQFEGMPLSEVLELAAVLESWLEEFPTARADIAAYLSSLTESNAYEAALKKYGTDWRILIASDTMLLQKRTGATLGKHGERETILAILSSPDKFHRFIGKLKGKVSSQLAGPAKYLQEVFDFTGNFRNLKRDKELREALDWAAVFYGRPENEVPVDIITPGDLLGGKNRKIKKLWLRIIGEITRSRDIKLVIYAQPVIAYQPKDYYEKFKPRYTDLATEWLAEFSPAVIDQTIDHNLTQQDFAHGCGPNDCNKKVRNSTGYFANIVGRLKQSRLLLDSLIDRGVLEAERIEGRRAWDGESRLPKTPLCVRAAGRDGTNDCLPWKVQSSLFSGDRAG